MAQRRMFSKKIVETDIFIDMPPTAKIFYFYLNMSADDDGFVGNPKIIKLISGATDDDFKILIAKQFIIPFDSGVIVIKDWKIHNYIAKDRYNETQYLKEKSELSLEKNGSYTKCIQDVIHYGDPGKDRVGKERLGEDRVGKSSIYRESGIPDDNQTAPPDTEKTTSVDNDILFKNYMDLFINFAKKNINKRSLALQTFIKLSEMEKSQIITGAKNYINFYKSDRPDDESGQYSINAFEFLDNAVFKEYQVPIKQNKANSPFCKYDPNADINDPGGWGPKKPDKTLNTDINDRGGW
ncbi:phage replisome organiser protein [Lactococcus sp. DD01]|uniref:phage replisome organizer protein n=1 Tax=Lactococcus sp. DD01 TaxID=1776443 RepID=UPI0007991CE6|nr:phage replisome organiser protein [Lactococcus sp. DD01]KXT62313.1 hypothetical protein LACDD01_00825 [Lactococcus sp. DD01]